MSSRKPTKEPTLLETSRLLDEVKSMADVLRGIEKELFVIKFSMADRAHVEAVKTELRLVRSDLATIEKRLPTAETAVEAKLAT